MRDIISISIIQRFVTEKTTSGHVAVKLGRFVKMKKVKNCKQTGV